MSRNAPHPSSAVEGYYSKFDLPNGSHIILVICTVRVATDPNRMYMVSFTYHPPELTFEPSTGSANAIWQRQYWDKTIHMRRTPNSISRHAFELDVPGCGYVRWKGDGRVEYDLCFNDFRFQASIVREQGWDGEGIGAMRESSPEGWLSILPIPLHWHVSSLRSRGTCSLKIVSNAIPQHIATRGDEEVLVHTEKNWGNSFPQSHMWVQARCEGRSSICLAGGAVIPGVKAFLAGYRSADLKLDFRPPFAMQLLGISPFLSSRSDWGSRTFELDIRTFTSRMVVKAKAPPDSFFTLGAPFPEGHRESALGQSFMSTLDVTIYRRPFIFMQWQEVRREAFERASLEFGGAYFGGFDTSGSKMKSL